jgi:hypothetical protein
LLRFIERHVELPLDDGAQATVDAHVAAGR